MIKGETYTVHLGSNLDILPTLADNSVDAIVTDPPYGLSDNKFVAETITRWINGERDFIPDGKGFMGKAWDAFVPPPAVWDECLRVLKPGGHLLAFFGSRTQDIGALSIRLAGFEIRDSIAWMYGSGFPKSLDISKAIDKAAGAEREVIGQKPEYLAKRKAEIEREGQGGVSNLTKSNLERGGDFYATVAAAGYNNTAAGANITAPSTPEAQQWEGWGTALKPAFEPIVVARKPLIGTVAENVLTYGTGGLNIDGSRIGTEKVTINTFDNGAKPFGDAVGEPYTSKQVTGRWPANVILDPYTAELLDEQSGIRQAGAFPKTADRTTNQIFKYGIEEREERINLDSGGASRFFYVAKASKRDRNEGLEELPFIKGGSLSGGEDKRNGKPTNHPERQNFHPTVKPTDLMRYLVKLVTPPGGTVLNPFTGSGSTGKAAILEGFNFIGIELTDEYLPIIEGRLAHAEKQAEEERQKKDEALF